MRIAVLGTGKMATMTADGVARAGHDVVLGSRHPDQHGDLDHPVLESAAAVDGADLVVNALDGHIALEALEGLREALAGHVLLDVGNAVDENFDLVYTSGSLGERIQRALPDTRVVKSLSTVWGRVAVDPGMLPAPSTVFLSGDEAAAKDVVGKLLDDLGWSPDNQVDLGDISTAKAVEHYFVLSTQLRVNFGDAAFNVALVR